MTRGGSDLSELAVASFEQLSIAAHTFFAGL